MSDFLPPLPMMPPNPDRFREECGVVGVAGHPDASNLAYLSLYAMQHRGQESCGIASRNSREMHVHRGMGLVNEHGQSSNDHGMTGLMELRWDMGTTLLGYGNNGLVRIGEDEVEWDDPVILWITMVDAGDQTHMVRPDRVDGGNNCHVELVIEGYIFSA